MFNRKAECSFGLISNNGRTREEEQDGRTYGRLEDAYGRTREEKRKEDAYAKRDAQKEKGKKMRMEEQEGR